jgi:hypothetical protein
MEQISMKRYGAGFLDSYSRSYLGCYYAIAGDHAKAREVLMSEMMSALALLSDEVDWNDYQGYRHLAEILMHVGDQLNALSTWSLLGPTDGFPEEPAEGEKVPENTEKPPPLPHDARSGNLGNMCDGRCGMTWHYADDFYCCVICPDIQLCSGCLGKLKAGTLRRFICNPKHEWLHVPKWNDEEFKETREGKVKIGGDLKDGVRLGYSAVAKEEWLNMLRDEWGIPRLEPKEPGIGEEKVDVNGSHDVPPTPTE